MIQRFVTTTDVTLFIGTGKGVLKTLYTEAFSGLVKKMPNRFLYDASLAVRSQFYKDIHGKVLTTMDEAKVSSTDTRPKRQYVDAQIFKQLLGDSIFEGKQKNSRGESMETFFGGVFCWFVNNNERHMNPSSSIARRTFITVMNKPLDVTKKGFTQFSDAERVAWAKKSRHALFCLCITKLRTKMGARSSAPQLAYCGRGLSDSAIFLFPEDQFFKWFFSKYEPSPRNSVQVDDIWTKFSQAGLDMVHTKEEVVKLLLDTQSVKGNHSKTYLFVKQKS